MKHNKYNTMSSTYMADPIQEHVNEVQMYPDSYEAGVNIPTYNIVCWNRLQYNYLFFTKSYKLRLPFCSESENVPKINQNSISCYVGY